MEDAAGLEVTGSLSVWEGGNCAVSKPETRTILNASEWKALWQEEFSKDPPEVDFEKHFAVAVFLGLRNTGGYSVEFAFPR